MSRYVFDIEADSLTPTKVWCVVLKDIDNGNYACFETYHEDTQPSDDGRKDRVKADREALQEILEGSTLLIGHNVIEYDLPALDKCLGIRVRRSIVRDTLVLSRLLNQARLGGHSLESWGERLGFPKGVFSDFSKFSEEMLSYCKQDVELNHRVYLELMKVVARNAPAFDKAIPCEMETAFICHEMHTNGFRFNHEEAKKIDAELAGRIAGLDAEIQTAFPPKTRAIREVTPRATKHGTISRTDFRWYDGTDYTQFSVGCPFTLFEYVPFNPGSPKQVVDILWDAGWKPVEKTKTHLQAEKERKSTTQHKRYGWKVNEVNVATLPDDSPRACQLLVEHMLLSARRRTLNEWFEAYNEKDQRIHGKFNALGTRTHRCAHRNPNMGNIATKKSIKYNTDHLRGLAVDYGGRMRSLWCCDDDSWLVGCDMDGAHLRIFAHLIEDEDFIKALVTGDKSDGTDVHSLNKQNLGPICIDRDRAKTFIFSWFNGAGSGKVAEIFNCSMAAAKQCVERYVAAYPGLRRLKEEIIPSDAAKGFFVGLDGRKVLNDSEHRMMGFYLQNAESVLMRYANIIWREKLAALNLPYRQINWVHDEWVTEVKGPKELAERVGQLQADSIRQVGELFNLRCPLAGTYAIGKTWLEVH